MIRGHGDDSKFKCVARKPRGGQNRKDKLEWPKKFCSRPSDEAERATDGRDFTDEGIIVLYLVFLTSVKSVPSVAEQQAATFCLIPTGADVKYSPEFPQKDSRLNRRNSSDGLEMLYAWTWERKRKVGAGDNDAGRGNRNCGTDRVRHHHLNRTAAACSRRSKPARKQYALRRKKVVRMRFRAKAAK